MKKELDNINYFEIVNAIVSYFEKIPQGEFVTYTEIEKITPLTRNTLQFSYAMAKAKNQLIEKGITLKTIVNLGYKVLEPREVADYVMSKVESAYRKLDTCDRIVTFTDKSKLQDNELEEINVVSDSVKRMRENTGREIVTTTTKIRLLKGVKTNE